MNDQIKSVLTLLKTQTAGGPTLHSCDLTFYRNKISWILHPSPHSIFRTRNKEKQIPLYSCHFCDCTYRTTGGPGSALAADFAGALNPAGCGVQCSAVQCINQQPSVLAWPQWEDPPVQRTGCWLAGAATENKLWPEDDIILQTCLAETRSSPVSHTAFILIFLDIIDW